MTRLNVFNAKCLSWGPLILGSRPRYLLSNGSGLNSCSNRRRIPGQRLLPQELHTDTKSQLPTRQEAPPCPRLKRRHNPQHQQNKMNQPIQTLAPPSLLSPKMNTYATIAPKPAHSPARILAAKSACAHLAVPGFNSCRPSGCLYHDLHILELGHPSMGMLTAR